MKNKPNPATKFTSSFLSDKRSAHSILAHCESLIKQFKTPKEALTSNVLVGQDYIFAWTAIENVFKLNKEQTCALICKYEGVPIPTFGDEINN